MYKKVGKLTITITEKNKISEQALKELREILERLLHENEEKKRLVSRRYS